MSNVYRDKRTEERIILVVFFPFPWISKTFFKEEKSVKQLSYFIITMQEEISQQSTDNSS